MDDPSGADKLGFPGPVLHSHWIFSALPGQQVSWSGLDKATNAQEQVPSGNLT